MAAHCPEEAGGMVGEVVGEQDDIKESPYELCDCYATLLSIHNYGTFIVTLCFF
jgi:hypothetical protein